VVLEELIFKENEYPKMEVNSLSTILETYNQVMHLSLIRTHCFARLKTDAALGM